MTITAALTDNSGNPTIQQSTLPLKLTAKGTDTFREADERSGLLQPVPGSTKVKAKKIDTSNNYAQIRNLWSRLSSLCSKLSITLSSYN